MKNIYTIGYGGRTQDEFLGLLQQHDIQTVVDVRLKPHRACMGIWVQAQRPEQGIVGWLTKSGIAYRWFVELGNLFLEYKDWKDRHRQLLDACGGMICERFEYELQGMKQNVALMCSEKKVVECHREYLAEFIANGQGAGVVHIE